MPESGQNAKSSQVLENQRLTGIGALRNAPSSSEMIRDDTTASEMLDP